MRGLGFDVVRQCRSDYFEPGLVHRRAGRLPAGSSTPPKEGFSGGALKQHEIGDFKVAEQ